VTVHTHGETEGEKKSKRLGKKSKKTFGKSQYVLEKSQKKLLEKVNTFWKKVKV
jgi:hypothetical protein